MARLRSIAAALGLLVLMSLAGPSTVFGCSCAGEMTMADVKGGDAAVFVGRVGQDRGTGVFEFAVERWFRGGDAATVPVQSGQTRMPDGSMAINTCGLNLQPGQHLILTARHNGNAYEPNNCSPFANVDKPEGLTMVADAQAVFGPGAPPGDEPAPPRPGIPVLGIALSSLLLVLLAGGVMLVARRERA